MSTSHAAPISSKLSAPTGNNGHQPTDPDPETDEAGIHRPTVLPRLRAKGVAHADRA